MFSFGMAGLAKVRFNGVSLGYPMAPLVLGLILGDLLDKNLRRALTLSDADLTPFFTRPISAVLAVTTLLLIASAIPAVRKLVRRTLPQRPV
jgi:putative tricarboxylic transport membrane protein